MQAQSLIQIAPDQAAASYMLDRVHKHSLQAHLVPLIQPTKPKSWAALIWEIHIKIKEVANMKQKHSLFLVASDY